MRNLTVKQFLQEVEEGGWTTFDIYIYCKSITDGFNPEMVKMLLDSIDEYLLRMQTNVREGSFLGNVKQYLYDNNIRTSYLDVFEKVQLHKETIAQNKNTHPKKIYFEVVLSRFKKFKAVRDVKAIIQKGIQDALCLQQNGATQSQSRRGPVHLQLSAPTLTEKTKEQKLTAGNFLDFLNGHFVDGKKIMSNEAHERLIGYVEHLVEFDGLPAEFAVIKQLNFPNGHLTYTFYLLHKKLYGTRSIKDSWITFLYGVFSQLSGMTKTTLKTKFSIRPKTYEKDMAKIGGPVDE